MGRKSLGPDEGAKLRNRWIHSRDTNRGRVREDEGGRGRTREDEGGRGRTREDEGGRRVVLEHKAGLIAMQRRDAE
ncbi:hypothetical protein E4U60_001922 [Claviceps pazoutovae]|uniref:Uncharacterized protein n=1 Tax=Claviceps pazoutovae TaxID=1649127 RepID=A0A9P7MC80_9HYPO|nr:hypothetical protein E4U60_001922 [Claviceps pazoutovae]